MCGFPVFNWLWALACQHFVNKAYTMIAPSSESQDETLQPTWISLLNPFLAEVSMLLILLFPWISRNLANDCLGSPQGPRNRLYTE